MRKVIYIVAVFITVNLFALPASAILIVDTGTPPVSWGGLTLDVKNQGLAGRFNVSSSYNITGIYGWMGFVNAGSLEAILYKGSVPGFYTSKLVPDTANELYRQSFPLTSNGSLNDWYGISGLNWQITPGDYWVAFQGAVTPSYFTGWMPIGAPHPLTNYATYWPLTDKYSGWDQTFTLGFRVNADEVITTNGNGGVPIIPEPATMFLVGSGCAGFFLKKRKQII